MMSMNSAYVDEMYFDYLRDPDSVSPEWRDFLRNYVPDTTVANEPGKSGLPDLQNTPTPNLEPLVLETGTTRLPWVGEADELVPLTSVGGRIAENMMQSLMIPTATSVRSVPVKALEENRRIANTFLARRRQQKLSFTHILAWAIVKALEKSPNLNNSYGLHNGIHVRVKRSSVNLGLAVDTTRKDGTRILVVPSIKNAQKLSFVEFVRAYDDLILRARTNKISPDDLTGATVTLTNPGTIGTVMSMPRLMEGQGTIIATGSIEFPAEFQAMMPEVVATLAISKVVTITSTYDHRIIQGAESGEFLQLMHELIVGEHRFYDQIFAAYEIPFEPIRWAREIGVNPFLPQDQPDIIDKEGRVVQLIHAYRVRGHVLADINPLGLEAYYYPELDPAYYGLTIWDLDREFDTGGLGGVKRATLRDIIDMLRDTYCDQIGIEWMHIQDLEKRDWLKSYIERSHMKFTISNERKLNIFKLLTQVELLEHFLHTKFLGSKRFSLEGAESTVVIIDQLLENSAENDLSAVVVGMAHRGRLNVLVNMMAKPLEKLFKEFEGAIDPDSYQGSGDVKYHLGARGMYTSSSKKTIPMFLAPNPSHLEAVDPVVEGMARALEDEIGDASHSKVLPILLHGDAAFAGQGVVMETLNMARLRGFATGGTIHLVINNQIGFTTSPEDSRSTQYATAVGKMLQVPILHVNGDDPEACRTAAVFAYAYREHFNEDVVIDMYCYRKYGHNEQDDPTATQPLLYKKIRNIQPVRKHYTDLLIAESILTPEKAAEIHDQELAELQHAYDKRGEWQGSGMPDKLEFDLFEPIETAISDEQVQHIVNTICAVPEDFNIHPKVNAEVDKRLRQYHEGVVQWGMAEALAIGSLISEGHLVRLSGQDTARGTFNHRQAVQVDIVNERRMIPINRLATDNKQLHIYDSLLSEYAVLGFEYGYSTIAKAGLTIWEAQFGDFANGAQIVIDQFIASAEVKWGQRSNITLLLPHGYDGQGPEHSSARIERFLQLCAQDNMIVCNFTSPANFFHALRRQVKALWRKPLVVFTPKGYLRIFSSAVADFTKGAYQELIDDSLQTTESVQRIVITTGKIHHELERKRRELNIDTVALVRVEQIYPFHSIKLKDILLRYPNAAEVVWCQEEPANIGAWFFVKPLIEDVLSANQSLHYVGRKPAASPATGSHKIHEAEQEELLTTALNVRSILA
ncbi:MAG: multifunctional oxoglutarate decarboxylase/oxoglutarate dehydrogenase thiamine pyrophosphate-binding subunit/dihydrolipoyllysine-residue succinyltransferase subunit [Ignavibacteria bacterium]|nr:multifunctional oxoglutarate decarboxylase/oxoglutarate dehydrogenase thiamine pyrophosphate-binding subunit/dihydrolipoyllysine-residue succinyltransferase subunit [Ignavibacteria bacterium]